jgi:hypothetical protein
MNRVLTVVVGLAASLAVGVAGASPILYVDAAAPGADPGNTWEDISASGYDFSNIGAIYDAASKSYQFDGGTGRLQGAATTLFDFETAKAGGVGNPFSVVMYINPSDGGSTAVLSHEASGTLQGWYVAPRTATGKIDMSLTGTTPSNRVFDRVQPMPAAGSGWDLIVMTVDGSGTASGVNFYINGSTTPMAVAYSEDSLTTSISNGERLRIGDDNNGGLFVGKVGFVEVWNEVLPASYSVTRWNGGDPVRAIPEPGTISLLIVGVSGLVAYAWRKRR